MRTHEEMWWEDSAGPHSIIESACDKLCKDNCVTIIIDDNMAFRHEMREGIVKALRDDIEYNGFEYGPPIDCNDCSDKLCGINEISLFVWENVNPYGTMQMRGNEKYIDYFIREEYLASKILWFKGIKDETVYSNLSAFVKQYIKKTRKKCCVVLETSVVNAVHTLPVVDTCSMLRSIDMMLYATMLFRGKYSGTYDNGLLVKYVGNLVANVCGQDAELAAILTASTDFINDNIIDRLREILEGGKLPSQRGEEYISGRAVHPIYLLHIGKEQYLLREITCAQIQTFFSFVEELRFEYIEKYHTALQAAVDNGNLYNDKEKKYPVTDIFDAEFGAILDCITRACSMPYSQQEYYDLEKLRKIRNDLAHHKLLSVDIIKYLLERYKQFESNTPACF